MIKKIIFIFTSIIILITTITHKVNAQTCPSGTSDYGTTTNCATKCTTNCSGPDNRCCTIDNEHSIEAGDEVTKDVIDSLNPLVQMQADDAEPDLAKKLSTPGGIISRFLGHYAFPIAGLILFVMLIWGGIEIMAGSATAKSADAGKQRITAALLGFLLLFASFWIAKILEMMFGIKIL